MAKQIIILKKQNQTGYFELTYLYWLTVPANQQSLRANPQATSAYVGASTAEVTAIQAGQVAEVSKTSSFTNGTGVAAIKAALINGYQSAQDAINNDQEWNYFGTYYDGSTWTIQGV